MATRRHAEIAGAGFAGLAAAIALRQRGWSVRVHEIEPELRAYGAGIFMWENGLRVLRALDAEPEVLAGAHEAPLSETRNDRGEQLSAEAFGPARGTRMITMTRQHLFAAMLNSARRLGVEFKTGSAAVAADATGVLHTADGRRYEADLVIGADGVKSKVRDSLGLLKDRSRYAQGVIRLLVPRGPADLATGADHVINFWSPTYRVLYVPCNATELYILLSAHYTDEAATALPVRKPLWNAAFPSLAAIFARIRGDQGRYDRYETTRLSSWSAGRVAIIGDAAHAMPPTLGQGAGCAMMNALGLAVALERGGPIEARLAEWEKRERPLTDHTQEVSAQFAQIRAGADGRSKWDDAALRTARCVPTGTEA